MLLSMNSYLCNKFYILNKLILLVNLTSYLRKSCVCSTHPFLSLPVPQRIDSFRRDNKNRSLKKAPNNSAFFSFVKLQWEKKKRFSMQGTRRIDCSEQRGKSSCRSTHPEPIWYWIPSPFPCREHGFFCAWNKHSCRIDDWTCSWMRSLFIGTGKVGSSLVILICETVCRA